MITPNDVRELMEKMAEDYGQSEFDSFRREQQNRTGTNSGSNAFDFRTSKPKPAAPKRVNYERNVKPNTTPEFDQEYKKIVDEEERQNGRYVGRRAKIDALKRTAKDVFNDAKREFDPQLPKRILDMRVTNALHNEKERTTTGAKRQSISSNPIMAAGKKAWGAITDPMGYLKGYAEDYDARMKSSPSSPYYGMTMQEARLASAKKSALARGESWDKDKENMINKMPISVGSRETFSNMGAYDPLQETLAGGERFGGGNIPRAEKLKKMISIGSKNADPTDERIVYNEKGEQVGKAYGYAGRYAPENKWTDDMNRKFEYVQENDGGYYRVNPNAYNDMNVFEKMRIKNIGTNGKLTEDDIFKFKLNSPGFFDEEPGLIPEAGRQFVSGAGSIAGSILDKLEDDTDPMVNLIGRNLRESGRGIKHGVQSAGRGIKHGVQSAGRGIMNAADWISNQNWF